MHAHRHIDADKPQHAEQDRHHDDPAADAEQPRQHAGDTACRDKDARKRQENLSVHQHTGIPS